MTQRQYLRGLGLQIDTIQAIEEDVNDGDLIDVSAAYWGYAASLKTQLDTLEAFILGRSPARGERPTTQQTPFTIRYIASNDDELLRAIREHRDLLEDELRLCRPFGRPGDDRLLLAEFVGYRLACAGVGVSRTGVFPKVLKTTLELAGIKPITKTGRLRGIDRICREVIHSHPEWKTPREQWPLSAHYGWTKPNTE